jgi:hypothetical protein
MNAEGTARSQRGQWWLPGALFLLGIALAAAGGAGLLMNDKVETLGITTTATVVEYPVRTTISTRSVDEMRVEFTTRDGEVVRTATTRFYPEDAVVGRRLQIRYDPQAPDRIQAANWRRDRSMLWVVLGLGAALAMTALGVVVATTRKGRS